MKNYKLRFEMDIEFTTDNHPELVQDYAWIKLSEARNYIIGQMVTENQEPKLTHFALRITHEDSTT